MYPVELYSRIAGAARSKELDGYVGSSDVLNRSFACTLCRRDFTRRDHVINHLESVHFPNSYEYNCMFCGMHFNTRNKLYKHTYKLHKEATKFEKTDSVN